jgi:hypothetical protein
MIGKRGASAVVAPFVLNALNREPGENPALLRSCFRGDRPTFEPIDKLT